MDPKQRVIKGLHCLSKWEEIFHFFSFDSIDDNTSLVQRADQILKMTHHSRPLFESNVRLAYDVLCKHKGNSSFFLFYAINFEKFGHSNLYQR